MDPHPDAPVTRLVFEGRSMWPTLREPALLDIEPVGLDQVRRGDVLAFRSAEAGGHVIHRAVTHTPAGWRTRGDNNPADDPELLTAERLLGRVVACSVGRQRRRVRNGGLGLAWHRWRRVARAVRGGLARAGLGRPLRWAARRCALVLARWLPRAWRPTKVSYADGRAQWVLGRRVLARQSEPGGPWQGRWWARLLVDEETWR
ncbi:MAG: hypothetical protein HZB16_15805 [Armatimonadetes bacterium]|nr:hypothetical protein [Armatimonadota bacterium]